MNNHKIEVYEREYEALLALEKCSSNFYKVWNNKRINLDLVKTTANAIGDAFTELDRVRRLLGLED